MDPHEVRMKAGEGTLQLLDALDDEVLDALGEVGGAMDRALDVLGERGVPRHVAGSMLTGIVMAAVLDYEG
jgi:hypothetical protein